MSSDEQPSSTAPAPTEASGSTSDATATPATAGDEVTINIKASDAKLSVTISLSKTVLDLKKAVADKTEPRVEAENQRCASDCAF